MIINAIIFVIVTIISAVFFLFPVVTIASIPLIGTTLSEILLTMTTTWKAFLVTFPYASTAWHMLLWVILPFEIGLLIVKFFLGQHTPAHI